MRRLAMMLLLAAGQAGCAGAAHLPGALTMEPDAARGQAVAQQRCASCHDIGQPGPAAVSGPSFSTLRVRYNALTLERRLAEIGRDGHFEMPRRTLQSSEIADLAAFMETVTKP